MFSFADGLKDIGWFKDFDVLLSSYIKPNINSIKQNGLNFVSWNEKKVYDFGLRKKQNKPKPGSLLVMDRWVREVRSCMVIHSEWHVICLVYFKTYASPTPFFFNIVAKNKGDQEEKQCSH